MQLLKKRLILSSVLIFHKEDGQF